jgi:hypothetical protein
MPNLLTFAAGNGRDILKIMAKDIYERNWLPKINIKNMGFTPAI